MNWGRSYAQQYQPRGGIALARLWWRSGHAVVVALLSLAGCTGCNRAEVDTTYGRSRGPSINGTSAFAALIRDEGHTVRVARQYNEVLGDWAQVIVRFAPHPGPPGRAEAAWLTGWLDAAPGRKLVYVPYDYAATTEFWTRMLAALPASTSTSDRRNVETRRDQARREEFDFPDRVLPAASSDDWFGTEPAGPAASAEATGTRALSGPWAEGVDSAAAALPCHEAIHAENDEKVLLASAGKKLAISWTLASRQTEDSAVLVLANGGFLLNASLLNQARRPLARRVVDWIGTDPGHVAFVEGSDVLDPTDDGTNSPFHLLSVPPFDWITAHLAVFGVLLCLALAATIGRPRPEATGMIERPAAHPIALGARFARTRQAELALEMLATYRRWRHPSTAAQLPASTPSSSSPSA